MTTDGAQEEIAGKLKAWERELERARLALARAPDSIHDRYQSTFIEVYRAKEVLRSRWEAARGGYQKDRDAIQGVQDALDGMEKAWEAAQPLFSTVFNQQGV